MKKYIKCFILILVLVVVFFLNCPTTFFLVETSNDYSHILKEVYDQNKSFGNVPVTKIAMLGSHDSLSNGINYFSKADTTRQKIDNDNFACLPVFFYFTKGVVVRMARAQNKNVYEQLKAGARYLDFRVTEIDGELYNSHGLVADDYKTNLELLLKFLDENPGEFVIVNILYYYGDTKSFDQMCDYTADVEYNGKNVFDYVNYDLSENKLSNIKYNDLTCNGTKSGLLFVTGNYDCSKYRDFFKLSSLFNYGNKEANYRQIDKKIENRIIESQSYDDNYLKINQTQITPDAENIIYPLLDWSLLNVSNKHNKVVIENGYINDWINYLPIYLTDDVTSEYCGFNSTANKTIQQYNIKIAENY